MNYTQRALEEASERLYAFYQAVRLKASIWAVHSTLAVVVTTWVYAQHLQRLWQHM